MTTAPAARKPPLPALTGLRTLMALSIVFFHFTPPHMGVFAPIFDNGYVFVGFFFLLSGFILSYNYADRTDLSKRDFWIARFSRLYPIYLLGLVFSFQMLRSEWGAHSHAEFWKGALLTPLLLQGWLPNLATFWNTVAWTLSCEIMLYVAFPFLIRVPLPKRPVQLIGLFLALWAVGLVPHLLYVVLNPDHLAAAADRYTSTYLIRGLKYTPPAYICTFLAGMTLGRIQASCNLKAHHRLVITAVSLLSLAAVFYVVLPRMPYIMLHGGLLMPLFAALTIGLSGPNLFASMFAFQPLVFVGRSTFCLYLLHFNALMLLRSMHVMERMGVEALDPWISYAAVIGIALLAHQFVEIPARQAILRFFKRANSGQPARSDQPFTALSFGGR